MVWWYVGFYAGFFRACLYHLIHEVRATSVVSNRAPMVWYERCGAACLSGD